MSRFCLGLALVAWVLFTSPSVHAQAGNPLIARGVSEVDDLRFEEALQTLSAARVRAGNTPEQSAQVYRYLALTYLALEREEEASGAWRSMLALSPDAQAGTDLSPRFREFFNGVRGRWESDGRPGLPPPAPVVLQHRSPPQGEREQAIELTAQVDDPGHRVRSVVLAYRQGTSAVFRRMDTTARGSDFVAVLPGEDVRPPLVEYYFEALDANGLPLASRGDVAAPLRIAVPAPGGDVTAEPWFWLALGGGAAVVAGAIILGVVLGGQTAEQGTLVITVD